jgi:hypothetical protein
LTKVKYARVLDFLANAITKHDVEHAVVEQLLERIDKRFLEPRAPRLRRGRV